MRLVLGVVVLVGCGASAAPQSTRSRRQDIAASLDGKRVVFVSGLAWSRSDGSVKVGASTRPLTCDGWREPVAGDEVRFSLELVHKLLPDGTLGWRVKGQAFAEVDASDCCTDAVEATIDPHAGAHSRVAIAAAGERKMSAHDGSRTLLASGFIDAVAAGRRRRCSLRSSTWPASRSRSPVPRSRRA